MAKKKVNPRYVDANLVRESLIGWDTDPTDEEIEYAIDNIPTADVVEVKRGEWKDRYGNKYDNHLYECSVCGEKALYEFYTNVLDQWEERQVLTPTCPYCFAKMDGFKK